MKNGVFWAVAPVGLIRTDVSDERVASIYTVERISYLGTTLAKIGKLNHTTEKH
jgi:hypothetical protein